MKKSDIGERRVESWDEFMDLILKLTYKSKTRLWYRGHSEYDWKLLPTVKRSPFNEGNKERFLSTDFYIEACRRMKNTPVDKAGWISLMQHYGLPTRLLDWSESPLIALYFATVDYKMHESADAVVWVLNPVRLNSVQGYDGYLFPMDYETVTEFLEPAFRERNEPNKIIACCSVENDLRMYMQQASFTVHSSNIPLEQDNLAKEFLYKIVIPKEIKGLFATHLDLCGYKLSNIFPDVEHISKELKEMFS